MTAIVLEGVTHDYGATRALDHVSLEVGSGTVTALLGPSGCGKTTALKVIAGLVSPTRGRVRLGDRDVTDVPAERRDAVMVFQDHRLFPYLTAVDNVAFGLRMRGVGARQRRARAAEALERVGLGGLGDRRPDALSGGQQQRVALARALVLEPRVLLLDEPLASLDTHLRDDLRALILEIHREHDLTTVVVTHDREEATVLADEIALLFDGRVHQHGAPRSFFERPRSARSARFFGAVNLLPATASSTAANSTGPDGAAAGSIGPSSAGSDLRLDTPFGAIDGVPGAVGSGAAWVTIRPERVVVDPAADRVDVHRVEGRVVAASFLGDRTRAVVDVDGTEVTVDVHDDALIDAGPGRSVRLGLPINALWTIPRESSAPQPEARPADPPRGP
ncbi:MAG: ABC transporter ATP-binding protein [Nitriliruptoraceae bacterium]|nr:ABC transporter ATP-binding protein [Nitriliruptoraceae bacterium]